MTIDEEIAFLERIASARRNGDIDAEIAALEEMTTAKQSASDIALTAASLEAEKNKPLNVSKTVRNLPGSIANAVKDTVSALASPIDSAKALSNATSDIAREGLADLTGLDTESLPLSAINDLAEGRQLKQFFKNRFGSKEAVKNTVENDPGGVFADLSLALTPVGAASRLPVVGSTASKVSDLARAIDPTNIAKTAIKAPFSGVSKLAPNLPKKLIRSAGKFSTVPDQQPAVRRATEVILDKKIPLTQKGADRVVGDINRLGNERENILLDSTLEGNRIPASDILNVDRAKNISRRRIINKDQNINQINKTVNRQADNILPETDIDGNLTPRQANEIKIRADREVNFKNPLVRKDGAELAFSDIGNNARTAVENVAPDVAKVNKELADLLTLEPILGRSANRIGNLDLNSLRTTTATTAGGTAAGPIGAAIGASVGLLELPGVKSRLAFLIDGLQKQGASDLAIRSALPTLIQQAAFQAGRQEEQ